MSPETTQAAIEGGLFSTIVLVAVICGAVFGALWMHRRCAAQMRGLAHALDMQGAQLRAELRFWRNQAARPGGHGLIVRPWQKADGAEGDRR